MDGMNHGYGNKPMKDNMVSLEVDGFRPQVTIPKANIKNVPKSDKIYFSGIATRVDGAEDEDTITIEFEKGNMSAYEGKKEREEAEPLPEQSIEESFDSEFESMNA